MDGTCPLSAAARLRDGAEDAAKTHIAALRKCFRLRWLGSHPCAVSVRRALLQPLQPATELEELLAVARTARSHHTGALGGRGNAAAAAAATRGGVPPRDAGVAAVEELLERWRRRWPSDALDPPEVWERVVSLRKIALEALHVLAPPAVAGSPAAGLSTPPTRIFRSTLRVRGA